MKAQSREMVNFLILVLGISIIFIITFFLLSSSRQSISKSLVQQHSYSRVTNAVNDFYYSKVSGTDVPLAQLFGDRVIAGEGVVSYGEGFPEVDVDNMTVEFFSSYFGDNWRLEVDSIMGGGAIPIWYDSSMIKHRFKLETIRKGLYEFAKETNTRIIIIVLDRSFWGFTWCGRFFEGAPEEYQEYLECRVFPRGSCQLVERDRKCMVEEDRTGENWGSGGACIIQKGLATKNIVAMVMDELSTGSEPCWRSDGGRIESEHNPCPTVRPSIQNLIDVAKQYGVMTFPLLKFRPCETGVEEGCSTCRKILTEFARQVALETGGEIGYFDGEPLAKTFEEIFKKYVMTLPVKLGQQIPNNKDVQTFELLIPVPQNKYRIAKGYLYVWSE